MPDASHRNESDLQVRATHGAHTGTWYFEVNIDHLGTSGHCRLGWCTNKGELQGPVRQKLWHVLVKRTRESWSDQTSRHACSPAASDVCK